MRHGTGIAGATLLYGPQVAAPDLLLAMQFLVDDLRGDGRRIAGLKLTGATLRLRADPFELVLTLTAEPLALASMTDLVRPQPRAGPDFARVHLSRALRMHQQALGFLLRRRGAPLPDPDETAHALAREGQLCLRSVIEAAPPSLLIWQPGGLVLSADEFRAADAALLLEPGDPAAPLSMTPPHRLGLPRPGQDSGASVTPQAPASRLERAQIRSGGRLFGGDPARSDCRAATLPRIERSVDRLAAALRDPEVSTPRHPGRKAAVKTLWASLLPSLTGFGGLS